MKEYLSEIFIAVLLVLITFVFINPYWMPMGMLSTALLIFAGLFVAFTVFFWREKKGDEREIYLRNIAGRLGYLAGALVLVVGIICEIVKNNMVNKWIIGALIAMIVAKIAGFVWARKRY